MRKRILGIAIAAVLLLAIFGIAGCSNSHGIPNGKYAITLEENHFNYSADPKIDFYWHISGNKADYYQSGWHTYKCKIIVQDKKVYFEGKTWREPFSSTEQGAVFKYEVVYNESTKSIEIIIE